MRKQLSEIVGILRGAVLEKPLQTIISDLEDKKEELVRGGSNNNQLQHSSNHHHGSTNNHHQLHHGTRVVLERGGRRESGRENVRRKVSSPNKN